MRTPIAVCLALIVAWTVENSLFGEDKPGTAHDVALAFFFVGVAAALTLMVLVAIAVVRRVRAGSATRD